MRCEEERGVDEGERTEKQTLKVSRACVAGLAVCKFEK